MSWENFATCPSPGTEILSLIESVKVKSTIQKKKKISINLMYFRLFLIFKLLDLGK